MREILFLPSTKPRTVRLAISALISAVYLVLGMIFHPISFLVFQVRVSNLLQGLVPILGWTAILGLFIGGLIYNATSPLGFIDMLNIPWGVCWDILTIYLYRTMKKKDLAAFIGLFCKGTAITFSVTWMLSTAFALPFWAMLPVLFVGIQAGYIGLGFVFYKAVRRAAPWLELYAI